MADEKEPTVEGPDEDPNPVLADCFRTLEAMHALQKHYAWEYICKIIQEHIDTKFTAIIEPSQSVDNMIPKEFMKGQCNSLMFVKNLPSLLIENARQTVMNMTGKSAEEHNHE